MSNLPIVSENFCDKARFLSQAITLENRMRFSDIFVVLTRLIMNLKQTIPTAAVTFPTGKIPRTKALKLQDEHSDFHFIIPHK